MTDHPGWVATTDGRVQRAFRSGGTVWKITCHQVGTTVEPAVEIIRPQGTTTNVRPVIDRFDPATLPPPFRDTPLIRQGGPRHRVRNTDLWDAILPTVLRQRRRTVHGARLYRTLCTELGERIPTPVGNVVLAPTAETVAAHNDRHFTELGLPGLRTVAETYLERGRDWARCTREELFHTLPTVPRIGKVSAATIIADLTNDFSFHEFAGFATPGYWEQFASGMNTDTTVNEFLTAWTSFDLTQRSTLTALWVDCHMCELHGKPRTPEPV